MCGIAGIFGYKNSVLSYEDYMSKCLQSMQRRGPDSKGIWHNDKNYIAGFVRLAIRDTTESGNQPMVSACTNYILSFNGEIYNSDKYVPLLKSKGVIFKSHSDTEVLLYALIHLGLQKVLEEFDGMFAFAFYSKQKNELILARDRAGIKPLYIGYSKDYLIYSSQYDHIINADFVQNNTVNYRALETYLQYGYMVSGNAIINNTVTLPNGHYIIVSSSGYQIVKFYDFARPMSFFKNGDAENIFKASVQSQLVSDVPLGTFLSSGVDSPLINCWAHDIQQVQAFTIGNERAADDESAYAKKYAEIIGVEHYCKTITEADFLALVDDTFKAFTEPFADFSSIPTMLVSKMAKEKVTVILSGDGPDELFWGYDRNVSFPEKNNLFHQSKWKLFAKKLTSEKKISKRYFITPDLSSFYLKSLQLYGAEYWLHRVLKYKSEKFPLYQDLPEAYINPKDVNTSMQMIRWLEMNIHLQRILLKVDRATMFYSLEARVPFLSNPVLAYAASLNYTDCIAGKQGKTNIKAMHKKYFPDEWADKKKQGFLVPMGDWINKKIKKDVSETILNMPQELAIAFNQKELKRLLDEQVNGKTFADGFIWAMYALVKWHANHRHSFQLQMSISTDSSIVKN